jgi:hypothetical protein
MSPSEEAAQPWLTPSPDDDETRPPTNILAEPARWGPNLVFAGLIVMMLHFQPSGWAILWTVLGILAAMWCVMVWVQSCKAWRDVRNEEGDAWFTVPRWRRACGWLWIVGTGPVTIVPEAIRSRRSER